MRLQNGSGWVGAAQFSRGFGPEARQQRRLCDGCGMRSEKEGGEGPRVAVVARGPSGREKALPAEIQICQESLRRELETPLAPSSGSGGNGGKPREEKRTVLSKVREMWGRGGACKPREKRSGLSSWGRWAGPRMRKLCVRARPRALQHRGQRPDPSCRSSAAALERNELRNRVFNAL